jgi:hypothetical protein
VSVRRPRTVRFGENRKTGLGRVPPIADRQGPGHERSVDITAEIVDNAVSVCRKPGANNRILRMWEELVAFRFGATALGDG